MSGGKMTKERLYWLDAAKGLGILLVVLGHIWETDRPASVLIYSFHVPFFFIISGILLEFTQVKKRAWSSIIKSRLCRLIVPYLVFEAIFIGVYALRSHMDFGAFEGGVWRGLLLDPQNTPLWFLAVLFVAELFLILLLKLEDSGRLAAVAGAVCYLAALVLGDRLPGSAAVAGRCMMAAAFLALGYFTGELVRKKDLPLYVLLPLLAADMALALFNGKVGIYKLTYHNPLIFSICAAAGSYILLFLLKKTRIRGLEIIGRNTVAILGLHIIVLRIWQEVLGFDTESWYGGVLALAAVTLSLVAVGEILRRTVPKLIGE